MLYPSPRQGAVGQLSLGGLDSAAYTGRIAWVSTVPLANRTHPGMGTRMGMGTPQELCLGSNLIGDDGAAALARSPSASLAHLTTLQLEGNRIGDRGCASLAAAGNRSAGFAVA